MISDRVPPGGKGGGKVSLQEEKGGRDFMTRPISHFLFFERRPPKKGKIVVEKASFPSLTTEVSLHSLPGGQ